LQQHSDRFVTLASSDEPKTRRNKAAQLNVLANDLVTDALDMQLRKSRMGSKTFCPLPSCPMHLQQANGHTITSREHQRLENCTPDTEMDARRRKKFGWTAKTLKSIDWTACRQARRQEADFMLKFATKLEIEWLPANNRLHRQKQREDDDQCMLCGRAETQAHLSRCPQRSEWRALFLNKLSDHLKWQRTAADIRVRIAQAVDKWLEGIEPTTDADQDAIGWEAFLRGHVTRSFTQQQEAFHRQQQCRKKECCGTQWARRLV
jgi:hypothetical protein